MTPAIEGPRFQSDTSRSGDASSANNASANCRVSSLDQNADRQLDGVDVDRIFTDHVSGKDLHRPQLEAMLTFVRAATPCWCTPMDRLARNLDDLRATVRGLTARGVRVQFLKGQLTFTGDDTAMATLLLSVMGAYRGRAKPSPPTRSSSYGLVSAPGGRSQPWPASFGISRETVY